MSVQSMQALLSARLLAGDAARVVDDGRGPGVLIESPRRILFVAPTREAAEALLARALVTVASGADPAAPAPSGSVNALSDPGKPSNW